jgi:hypothetical protein
VYLTLDQNSDHFDPNVHLAELPSYWGNLADPDLLQPHLERSIADAADNNYRTYILQCQMTPQGVADVLFK